ncbi:MAG: chorismate lyase [Betaproteobacteria bacterium]|nr:chorismate lyase [Betaproteobacteria bacterium]
MKRAYRDTRWHRAPPPPAGDCRQWLTDRGSLTCRIQSRCKAFRVKVVRQGLERANRDEQRVVTARRGLALVREVFLYCGRTPVVFAHSIAGRSSLRGAWRRLGSLGAQPLGEALFADPRVKRYPLRFARLNRRHELYARACRPLRKLPACLWARRSLFVLRGAPLLVTEVFLPGILKLA